MNVAILIWSKSHSAICFPNTSYKQTKTNMIVIIFVFVGRGRDLLISFALARAAAVRTENPKRHILRTNYLFTIFIKLFSFELFIYCN